MIYISIDGWIQNGPIAWIAAIIVIGTLSWTFASWVNTPGKHFVYLSKQGAPEPEAQEPHSPPQAGSPKHSPDDPKDECGGR